MKRKKVTLQIIGICLMMLFLCEGCKEQEIQMTEEVAEEPSSRKEEESHQQICESGFRSPRLSQICCSGFRDLQQVLRSEKAGHSVLNDRKEPACVK